MSKEQKVVNINVLGRDYPVRCTTQEERELLEIEEKLKRQLNQYRLKYERLDNQDCLSMALIEILMDARQSAQVEVLDASIRKVDRLRTILAQALS